MPEGFFMDCCLEIPGYFTSQRQAEHLRRLRREFPFVYIHELTRTAYGRPIHALQIGSGDRKVLLTAGHHANETITSEVLWRFLFTYCKALRAERTVCGADALSLYHEAMVYLVPLVNPDGADLAAGAIAPGSAEYCAAAQIAAGFPDVPFPSGWKANLSGVDLNLNYPARWEEARSIKAAKGFGQPALCGLHPPGSDAGAAHAGPRDLSRACGNSAGGQRSAGKSTRGGVRLCG